MRSIVVAGALANKPRNGGAAWTRLSWALGFRRLGFDVFFLERIARESCVDHANRPVDPRQSLHAAYFRAVTAAFGLAGASALVLDDGAELVGEGGDALRRRLAAADALVDISGNLAESTLLHACRRRLYIDLDPGYTQAWHANGALHSIADYDCHFTVGENIGRGATIPLNGINWRPVRQPVLLDQWPACAMVPAQPFTTVASWRGAFGPVTVGQQTLGVKAHEFRKFLVVPRLTARPFQIALDIHSGDAKDRQALEEHGWTVLDPVATAGDPDAFRRYVQQSAAEFSVAQNVYVQTGSGWFSDRTTRYLASGRPAVVQDTGFSRNLPVGEGLFAFRTIDEAVAAVEAIDRDYGRHARAARALAEEYFDARKVLGTMAAAAGLA